MASATTRPTFSFHHHSTSLLPQPPSSAATPKPKSSSFQPFTTTKLSLQMHQQLRKPLLYLTPKSLDVSKEDYKPTTTTTTTSLEQQQEEEEETTISAASDEEDLSAPPPRRPEERFAVLNTGIHECRSCGYQYNEAAGDPSYPVPPGLPFNSLPEDWRCPTCGAAKGFFVSKSVEIAGFAENQQFGLGGNTLTSGQKAVLIYGSLLLGFIFFLSGYFLQ